MGIGANCKSTPPLIYCHIFRMHPCPSLRRDCPVFPIIAVIDVMLDVLYIGVWQTSACPTRKEESCDGCDGPHTSEQCLSNLPNFIVCISGEFPSFDTCANYTGRGKAMSWLVLTFHRQQIPWSHGIYFLCLRTLCYEAFGRQLVEHMS